eukprot:246410_1
MMTSIHYFHMVQVFVSVFIAQYVFKTYYFTFHIAHNAPPIHRNVTLPVGSEGLASSSTFDTTSRASSMDTHSVPASSLPPPQNINHCMNEDCGATCDGVPSMPQATQNHGSFMAMPQPYATSNASFMGGNGLVSMPSYHMRPMQPLSMDIAYAAPYTHYPTATPANRNTYPHPSIPPIPLPQMFMDRVDLLQCQWIIMKRIVPCLKHRLLAHRCPQY